VCGHKLHAKFPVDRPRLRLNKIAKIFDASAEAGRCKLIYFWTMNSIMPDGARHRPRQAPLGMAFATTLCATISMSEGRIIRPEDCEAQIVPPEFLRMSDLPRWFSSTTILDETAILHG
jgi:hypothetical protein